MNAKEIVELAKIKAHERSRLESFLIDSLGYDSWEMERLSVAELKGLVEESEEYKDWAQEYA